MKTTEEIRRDLSEARDLEGARRLAELLRRWAK